MSFQFSEANTLQLLKGAWNSLNRLSDRPVQSLLRLVSWTGSSLRTCLLFLWGKWCRMSGFVVCCRVCFLPPVCLCLSICKWSPYYKGTVQSTSSCLFFKGNEILLVLLPAWSEKWWALNSDVNSQVVFLEKMCKLVREPRWTRYDIQPICFRSVFTFIFWLFFQVGVKMCTEVCTEVPGGLSSGHWPDQAWL